MKDVAITGRIVRLGQDSAELFLTQSVGVHSDIKVRLSVHEASEYLDLYAKVLDRQSSDPEQADESVLLQFTSVPDDTRVFLDNEILRIKKGQPD